jgi:DNA-directed RNA polymerase I, II, and III subunit RPABC1
MEDPTWEFFRVKEEEKINFYELKEIKSNQIRMMKDRGYIIPEPEMALLNSSVDYFRSYYERQKGYRYDKLNQQYIHSTSRRKVNVIYIYLKYKANSISKEDVKGIYITDNDIVIFETKFTSSVQEYIGKAEVFYFHDFFCNVIEYFLVPKHEILTEEETKELIQRNRLDVNTLPWISYEDPIVRYYGAKVGQIIRITRETLIQETTVDEYITYRIVKNIKMNRGK